LRHGKAVRDHEDRTRPLTDRGERQSRWLGEAMRAEGFRVDRVLHSEKLRARQTAALFAERALPGLGLEMVEGLLPEDDVDPWVERFEAGDEDVLLVGHNPFMEHLAYRLVGQGVPFRTATLAGFERGPEGWTLLFSKTPPDEV
jgi:phosphohistidine phosphatase